MGLVAVAATRHSCNVRGRKTFINYCKENTSPHQHGPLQDTFLNVCYLAMANKAMVHGQNAPNSQINSQLNSHVMWVQLQSCASPSLPAVPVEYAVMVASLACCFIFPCSACSCAVAIWGSWDKAA